MSYFRPKSALPKLLENISYDSEGDAVVGATSLMNVWLMEYNAGEKVRKVNKQPKINKQLTLV